MDNELHEEVRELLERDVADREHPAVVRGQVLPGFVSLNSMPKVIQKKKKKVLPGDAPPDPCQATRHPSSDQEDCVQKAAREANRAIAVNAGRVWS